MIFFYSGWGILAVPLAFIGFLMGGEAAKSVSAPEALAFLIQSLIGGGFLLFMGRLMNDGERDRSSFMFINVEYYGIIWMLIGLYGYADKGQLFVGDDRAKSEAQSKAAADITATLTNFRTVIASKLPLSANSTATAATTPPPSTAPVIASPAVVPPPAPIPAPVLPPVQVAPVVAAPAPAPQPPSPPQPTISLAQSSDVPSDQDIINGLMNGWKAEDMETIDKNNAEIASIGSTAAANGARRKAAQAKQYCETSHKRCYVSPNGRAGTSQYGGAFYNNYDECNRDQIDSCVQEMSSDWNDAVGKIQELKTKNAKLNDEIKFYDAIESTHVLSVRSKANYEGNIISVVAIRKKGTDQLTSYKISEKFESGTLSLQSYNKLN